MPTYSIPTQASVTYALQSNLDRAIEEYKTNLKKNGELKTKDKRKWDIFVQSEENKVRTVAQLQQRLVDYRKSVTKKTIKERVSDKHQSKRLNDNMHADGLAKPNQYYHAHAMISGQHNHAWRLRLKLAQLEVGVDDSYNGCWLPENTKASGRPPYPKAVPHSRIHRTNYYLWLNVRFLGINDKQTLLSRLKMTRIALQESTFPPEVMLKKGEWERPYDNL